MGSAVGQGEEESSLGFQAAQTDKVTGRILLGPRQYDPTTERFTTADSFVSSSADLSLGRTRSPATAISSRRPTPLPSLMMDMPRRTQGIHATAR
jgi:RHS repeat-associated protein